MTLSIEMKRPLTDENRARTLGQLAVYFGSCFVITWGIGAAVIFFRPQLEAVIGPIGPLNHHWLYYLAVSAPTISAVLCSLFLGGLEGLKSLASRFVRPFRAVWLFVAIFLWPIALAIYEVTTRALGLDTHIDLHAIAVVAPTIALTTPILIVDPGGFGEETGWRGYALPRLLSLYRPLTASCVLGVIWAVWHLPAFFLSDLAQSHFGFIWFLVGAIFECVFMSWIFLNANGNVIVCGIIPHLLWNLMFDAHAFLGKTIETETTALGILVVVIVFVFGLGLRRGEGLTPQP